ncbi:MULTISPECIES: phage tail protein [Vibrio]|uniref:phage tail protein n=1 Tax=Vibrio TaxID=662 RepID=UPI000CB187CE|nr:MULTISPECIES: phage tail protein [Vibrio]PMP51646.1 hypothetical protein BCS83_02280 [Vibrio splendidus]
MAEPGVNINLNFAKELQLASAMIEATPKQLEKAGARAIKKTMRWVHTRIARELSQQLGIPQKNLKPRFSLKTVGKGADAVTILWMGTANVLAEKAGKARQTRAGVSIGKRRYQGAFIRDMYGYDDAVWIRASRNNGQYATTGRKRKPNSNSISPEFRGRFPVQHVAVEVNDLAAEVFRRFESRIPDQFRKILGQEINYVMNHERSN